VFIGPPICTLLIGISTAWVLAGRGVLMPRSVNECAVAIRRVRRRFEERPIGIPSRCGLVTLGLPAKRGTVLTHRSREWQKNITIRILLSVKILIEFRPQCPGSIHYSVCGEKGAPCRLGGGDTWGVFDVELGRRDVHDDGRVCRLCRSLHRDLAVVGVTLLESGSRIMMACRLYR